MGRAEPETLGDSDIMAIVGSFAFCCFFMPCVDASLEQALKNYYPATYLQSPHLQSCGSLQKKNQCEPSDGFHTRVCGKGAKISKDDTDAESPTKFRQTTKGLLRIALVPCSALLICRAQPCSCDCSCTVLRIKKGAGGLKTCGSQKHKEEKRNQSEAYTSQMEMEMPRGSDT